MNSTPTHGLARGFGSNGKPVTYRAYPPTSLLAGSWTRTHVVDDPDWIRDPHGILFHKGGLYVAMTGTNTIYRLHADTLERLDKWQFLSSCDCWHINDLFELDGEIYFSAFGKFKEHRGWAAGPDVNEAAVKQTGFIQALHSETPLLEGLNQPHSPMVRDETLFVCDSGNNRVLIHDLKSGEQSAIMFNLQGYVRGLDINDDYIFVGVSKKRKSDCGIPCAKIVVVSRDKHSTIAEQHFPGMDEIYSIKLV